LRPDLARHAAIALVIGRLAIAARRRRAGRAIAEQEFEKAAAKRLRRRALRHHIARHGDGRGLRLFARIDRAAAVIGDGGAGCGDGGAAGGRRQDQQGGFGHRRTLYQYIVSNAGDYTAKGHRFGKRRAQTDSPWRD